jgi:hypothetical protein
MQAAVESEDYEMAKRLKADIDKLRSAGEAVAGASHISTTTYHRPDPDEIFNRVLGRKGASPTPHVPSHLIPAPGRQGSSILAGNPNAIDGMLATAGPAGIEIDSQPVGPAPATAIDEAGPESIPPTTASLSAPRLDSVAHGQSAVATSADCQPPEGSKPISS